jgi:ABC-type Fe3+-hydroxamate transport system substrate-binding protein
LGNAIALGVKPIATIVYCADDNEAAQKIAVRQNPLWQGLKAVQNNRVHSVNYPT